ncbi:MAG TPA: ribonucleotide-diphosphate reductase subunit beta, partial [Myxococcota bacterium]|nr:ribonucleotide-diphosphate reductase subunit beta [Myxococcota bacterium]
YVYYLRSKGLLHGLATGTNWVFRDESAHMEFAFALVDTVREEEPDLFDSDLEHQVREMLKEAILAEHKFGEDVLVGGIPGFSLVELEQYLQCVADQRLVRLGFRPMYYASNPFSFMELQNVQELANFFERRVSAYQIGVTGEVAFDESF